MERAQTKITFSVMCMLNVQLAVSFHSLRYIMCLIFSPQCFKHDSKIVIHRELKTHAPYSEQPKLDRTREELSESERPLYDSFMNDEFVNKIFIFLALEEEKSTDKFRQSVLKYYKVRRERPSVKITLLT